MSRDLKTHRFEIKPESSELIHQVTGLLEKIRKVAPQEVIGASFFGSRAVSQERHNPSLGQSSDLDFCLYYDGTKLDPDRKKEVVDRLEFLVQIVLEKAEAKADVLMVDASRQETDKEIAFFKKNVVEETKNFNKTLDLGEKYENIGKSNFRLVSRFFLGVGDALYANRKYILDQLSQDRENGEKYFQVLMQFLQFCERTIKTKKRLVGLQEFGNYPKTIEEARTYFLTKPPKVTKKE